MRCLALFTGGLDAQLAVRLVQQQGIEVVGLYVATPLCAADLDRRRPPRLDSESSCGPPGWMANTASCSAAHDLDA